MPQDDRVLGYGVVLTKSMMMEAVRTNETSVYLYETSQSSVTEGCHLHTRRREKMKYHNCMRIRVV
jgi:hypothetical protein